jgi:hypothetical protein
VAYDEGLATRLRDLMGGESGLTEKKMFGGLATLLHGDALIVRTDRPATVAGQAAVRPCRPSDPGPPGPVTPINIPNRYQSVTEQLSVPCTEM